MFESPDNHLRAAGPLALACALCLSSTSAQNLGFENKLESWRLIRATGGLEHAFDTKEKKEGKQSLHLSKTGRFGMDHLRRVFLGVEPGKKFQVSAMIKTRGLQNGWFKCFFDDENGKTVGYVERRLLRGQDWKRITLAKEAPAGTAQATVMFLVAMPGDMWVDDVQIGGAAKPAKAAPTTPPKPLPRKTETWLDKNAIPIDSLDFGPPTSKAKAPDLQKLKRIIGDARIVQLGENSHGDGEAFRAKARLARFLHAEMGFDVLIFESGLYECEQANEIFRAGKAKEAAMASVFGIWRVKQVLPLYEYIAAAANSKRPLRLSGFDTRGSGTLASKLIPKLLEAVEKTIENEAAFPAEDRAALLSINKQLDASPYKPDAEDRARASRALEAIRAVFDKNRGRLVRSHSDRQVALGSQCLDNFVAREEFEYSKNSPENSPGRATPGKSVNLRDKQMAANFRWLADEFYKGKKIITWAATFHQAHNLERVSINGNKDYYKNTRGMGEYLHEWYGKQLFTIGFCAYEGEAGIMSPKFEVERPREGSFEDLMARYGKPYLFVPLRGRNPFSSRMFCAPMAYGRNTSAPWPEVLDALFFIREMTATEFMGR